MNRLSEAGAARLRLMLAMIFASAFLASVIAIGALAITKAWTKSDTAEQQSATAEQLARRTDRLARETAQLARQIQAEGRERRSQTCTTFEGQHRDEEVRALRNTYRYLLELTPTERREPLNRFVIRELPKLERNAASDSDSHGVKVPAYCDDPGIGLPEPDPVAPKRPRALRHLAR